MGILGKDLVDNMRSRTHVKVQFGKSAYWIEDKQEPHPYGSVLTELLNCDITSFEQVLSTLEQAVHEEDAQTVPRAFMDVVGAFAVLPYVRLFLSDFQGFKELRSRSMKAAWTLL